MIHNTLGNKVTLRISIEANAECNEESPEYGYWAASDAFESITTEWNVIVA
jgi:hypothetical protein